MALAKTLKTVVAPLRTGAPGRPFTLEELLAAVDLPPTAVMPEFDEEVVPACFARGVPVSRPRGRRGAATVSVSPALRPPHLRQVYVPKVWPERVDKRYARRPPVKVLNELLVHTDYPWCAIGRVEVTRRGQPPRHASGVLVGPNLLLTASHSMPWDTADSSVRFSPAFRGVNDPRFGHSYVDDYYGIPYEFDDDVTGFDYVICKLNWRIGDRTGWLGSQSWGDEDKYYDGTWFSVGYPLSFAGGFLPSVELGVSVEDIDNDSPGLEIETDNFTSKGGSGGPLWGWIDGDARVIGVLSGHEKDVFDPTRSVFAGGRHMVDLVRYGYANWV
jgi:hypothetical protein